MEFIVLVLAAMGVFFLPFIFSVMAMASCQSLKKRVEKLEVALKDLAASPLVSGSFSSSSPREPGPEKEPDSGPTRVDSLQEVASPKLALAKEEGLPLESAALTDSKPTPPPLAEAQPNLAPKAAAKAPKGAAPLDPTRSEDGLEQFFLGRLFNKLGALAIIVFIILFIKWLSPFLALTAAMKVGAVYLLSSLLVGLGCYLLPKDNMRGFSETILGLGLASAIMITYAGSVYFDLWDTYISLALASLVLLGTYILAYWTKRKAIICLGALAGYANLIFIQTSIDSTYVFDVYLVILALFCLIGTVHCRKGDSLFSLNLIITWLFIAARTGIFEKADRIFSPYALGAIWLTVLVYDYFRRPEEDNSQQPSIWVNHLIMALGANCLYSQGQAWAFFMVAALALFALAKQRIESRPILAGTFAKAGLLVVALSVYNFQEPLTKVFFLSVAGLIILWIAFNKVADPELKRRLFFYNGLYNGLAFYIMLASDFNGQFDFFLTPHRELHSLAIVIFGVSIVAWLLGYFMFKHYRGEEKYRDFYLWAAITLAYIYLGRELADILDRVLDMDGRQWWAFSSFSLIAVSSIYALQAMLQAQKSKSNSFAVGFNLALAMSVLGLGIYIFSCIVDTYVQLLPIVNIGFLAHALTILALVAAFMLYGSNIYLVGALLSGWSLVHLEGHNIVAVCYLDSITSVLWMLYAAAILWGGIRFKNRYVTNCGIFIVCVTLLRVITYDIVNLPIGSKLLLFFVLGVALLVTSYYYSKRLGHNNSCSSAMTAIEPKPSPSAPSPTAKVVSSKDTQELKEIEIPDLSSQKAFKEVDSSLSQSPFSDRLNGGEEAESLSVPLAEDKNGAERISIGEASSAPVAAYKASWHND